MSEISKIHSTTYCLVFHPSYLVALACSVIILKSLQVDNILSLNICTHLFKLFFCQLKCYSTPGTYLAVQKNFFIVRVMEHWSRFPREADESASVEILKAHVDIYLYNLL